MHIKSIFFCKKAFYSTKPSLDELPNEVLLHILKNLPARELRITSMLNKEFYRLSNSFDLWHNLLIKEGFIENSSLIKVEEKHKKLQTPLCLKETYKLFAVKPKREKKIQGQFTSQGTMNALEVNAEWRIKSKIITRQESHSPESSLVIGLESHKSYQLKKKGGHSRPFCFNPKELNPLIKLSLNKDHAYAIFANSEIYQWELKSPTTIYESQLFRKTKTTLHAALVDEEETIFLSTTRKIIIAKITDKLSSATFYDQTTQPSPFSMLEKTKNHLFAASSSEISIWNLTSSALNNLNASNLKTINITQPNRRVDLANITYLHAKKCEKKDQMTSKLFVGDQSGYLHFLKFSADTLKRHSSTKISQNLIVEIKWINHLLYVTSMENMTYRIHMLFKMSLVTTFESKEAILNLLEDGSYLVLHLKNGNIRSINIEAYQQLVLPKRPVISSKTNF